MVGWYVGLIRADTLSWPGLVVIFVWALCLFLLNLLECSKKGKVTVKGGVAVKTDKLLKLDTSSEDPFIGTFLILIIIVYNKVRQLR